MVFNPILLMLQTMTDVTGNPEEERHCDFYDQPWSHEAVCRYFYGKVNYFFLLNFDKRDFKKTSLEALNPFPCSAQLLELSLKYNKIIAINP